MKAMELLDVHGVQDRIRLYQETIQPIIKEKCRIYSMCPPSYLLHKDGKFEKVDEGLTEPAKAALHHLDEMLRCAASTFGLKEIEI